MPLQWHLVRLVLAALLPLVLLASTLVWSALRADAANRQQAMVDVARGVAFALDSELEQAITALQILAQSNSVTRGDVQSFRRRAEAAMEVQTTWAHVLMFDAEGNEIVSLGRAGDAPLPAAPGHAALLREVVQTGKPRIFDNMPAAASQPLVYVAVPAVRNGRVKYVLEAVIPTVEWTPWLSRLVAAGWIAAIDNAEGYVMARSEEPEKFVGRRASDQMRDAYAAKREGTVTAVGLAGRELHIAYHGSALTGWYVLAFVPVAVADAGARRVAFGLIGALLAASVLAVLLALWTARPLASGIAALRDAIASLGRGERPQPAPTRITELAEAGAAAVRAAGLAEARAARVEALQGELAARAEAAERASSAKDEFLAMLSHELRTPLGAIANAAAVLERTALPPDAARMGGIVQRQSRHLTTMVDDLLDVSRVVSNKVALRRERVDLGALAARLAAELRAAGRLGAHELRLDAAQVTVTGDPDRLLQVLRNLVDNALKYTPEGGRVDLRVAVEDEQAVVRVVDTGAGIEPAFAELLFEPFVQGAQSFDRPAGGLGLGLAIVRGIVRLHGGSVTAQSEGPGRGCEFVVRLPLAAETAPAGAGPAATERARPLRIALIEDHADTRASLRALLEAEGHSVREAADGESGGKLLAADPPDLAFVDLGLPRIDGFDVAKAARRAGVASRLVALTGYAQPEDRSRALKAGFDAVLVKPATLDALREALAQTPPRGAAFAAAGGSRAI